VSRKQGGTFLDTFLWICTSGGQRNGNNPTYSRIFFGCIAPGAALREPREMSLWKRYASEGFRV